MRGINRWRCAAQTSRFFKDKSSYSENTLNLSAENKLVEQHNDVQLQNINAPVVQIQANDEIPNHINLTESQMEETKWNR